MSGGDRIDRFENFVGLLEQKRSKRLVRLCTIPRAVGSELADKLVEANKRCGDRVSESRNPQRRQMVGVDRRSELAPFHLRNEFVGGSKPLENCCGLRRYIVERQDDIVEHVGGMHLRDEQRAKTSSRIGQDPVGVGNRYRLGHWIDSESGPTQIGKSHRRSNIDLHAIIQAKKLDGVLSHIG